MKSCLTVKLIQQYGPSKCFCCCRLYHPIHLLPMRCFLCNRGYVSAYGGCAFQWGACRYGACPWQTTHLCLVCIRLWLVPCACGLWLYLHFPAEILISLNYVHKEKGASWSGGSHMEPFLFSHSMLSTPGAFCVLDLKSEIKPLISFSGTCQCYWQV